MGKGPFHIRGELWFYVCVWLELTAKNEPCTFSFQIKFEHSLTAGGLYCSAGLSVLCWFWGTAALYQKDKWYNDACYQGVIRMIALLKKFIETFWRDKVKTAL